MQEVLQWSLDFMPNLSALHEAFIRSSTMSTTTSTQTSQADIRCIVLRGLLLLADKHLACPFCLVCRSRYDNMKDHCEKEGDEIHKGLVSKAFPTFHHAYSRAIAWEGSESQLRLPSSRARCFDITTVIEFKRQGGEIRELDLLIQAAEKSAVRYICPYDLGTFSDMPSLRGHWYSNPGEDHQKLASQAISVFTGSYEAAMGCEIKDLPLGLNRPGTPSPHKCFEIAFVMKKISTARLNEWYNQNVDRIMAAGRG